MKNKIIKESAGRDLVGAGNFASRSSVVQKILKKYPNPKSLASALSEIANNTKEPKAAAKLMQLSKACAMCTPEQYPVFVKKIAGFSKLWGIVGKTVGVAALAGATTWLVSAFIRSDAIQNSEDARRNAALLNKPGDLGPRAKPETVHIDSPYSNPLDDGFDIPVKHKHSFMDTIKGMKGVMGGDIETAKDFAKNGNPIGRMIMGWNAKNDPSSKLQPGDLRSKAELQKAAEIADIQRQYEPKQQEEIADYNAAQLNPYLSFVQKRK